MFTAVRGELNIVEEESATNKTYLLLTTAPDYGKWCAEAAGLDTGFLNEHVDLIVLQVPITAFMLSLWRDYCIATIQAETLNDKNLQ